MKRTVAAVALAILAPAATFAGPVSGKVVVLEEGGAERKVLSNVLVYLEGVPPPPPPKLEIGPDGKPIPPPEPPPRPKQTITSSNKTFVPRLAAVAAGDTVVFPNVDDIMHNVFSLSRPKRFDLGLYKSGARKQVTFERPGLVRVYCNIHPQMSAFVRVLPDRYFAEADPMGVFRIDEVPPGRYTLHVWHEEGQTSQPVVVTERGARGVAVTLDVSGYKKRPHLNKFGKPYKRKRGKY